MVCQLRIYFCWTQRQRKGVFIMDTLAIILIIIAAVIVAVGVWMSLQKRRTEKLRSQFGPEYDRIVQDTGDKRKAEKELQEREKRVSSFNIQPLSREDRQHFAQAWQEVQSRFVDAPRAAVVDADHLVGEAMKAQGYPMGDFEQRAADISVDHPEVIENYRMAHAVAQRDQRGQASTEDLRKAMVHYRALFDELLQGYIVAETAEVRR